MNKRDSSKKYKSSKDEDKEIKSVAYASNVSSRFILGMVIFAVAMFLVTIMFSLDYYTKMNTDAYKIIEYKKDNNRILITSNGDINETINPSKFNTKGEYTIIKDVSIELRSSTKEKVGAKINFDVKYDVLKNTFEKNLVANNDSKVVVRFSYSYDMEEWIYINNVISSNESTLSPLMGSFFDIAGFTGTLKISTNNELAANLGEVNKMYWRCETVFQNITDKNLTGDFKANFSIEYNG